jgi:S-adenosylmethionine:tRNA ribosyltransferase-isomerase
MALAGWMEAENLEALRFSTRLYLMPGYDYRIVKGLITNFHQPKSTLMVLVSSFIGENWRKVYEAALSNRYRFLSYGDSSFLMP